MTMPAQDPNPARQIAREPHKSEVVRVRQAVPLPTRSDPI
jgi:hypothetical protein